MQHIELKPVGKSASRIGLGCARLDGRAGMKRSAKLLETALELGINYFDVASSYGNAEEALGEVIGDMKEVVIATKVGPPRPGYSPAKAKLKELIRPAIDRAKVLKSLLSRAVNLQRSERNARPRYDFTAQTVERSLEESLRRLRRDRVDILLAHEPHHDDLCPEISAGFQSLVDQNRISAFGVGINAAEDQWAPFGSIWQSGWPDAEVSGYQQDVTYLFHGVLRNAQRDQLDRTITPVADLVRQALAARPETMILVSASTPSRLRSLVEQVDG